MTAVPIHRLVSWRGREAEAAIDAGAPDFMDLPDAWFDDPHWFCGNGHVSGRYLSGDADARCLACGQPVVLGPAIGEIAFGPILASMRTPS